jgi:hypothetical protein
MNKTKTIIGLSVASVVFLVATPFVFICSKKANSPYVSTYQFTTEYGRFIDLYKAKSSASTEGQTWKIAFSSYEFSFVSNQSSPEQFVLRADKKEGTKEFSVSVYFASSFNYAYDDGVLGNMTYKDSASTSDNYGSGQFNLAYDGTLDVYYSEESQSLTSEYQSLIADDFSVLSSALKTEGLDLNGKAFLLERGTSVRDYRKSLREESAEKSGQATLAAFSAAVAVISSLIGVVIAVRWAKSLQHPNA